MKWTPKGYVLVQADFDFYEIRMWAAICAKYPELKAAK